MPVDDSLCLVDPVLELVAQGGNSAQGRVVDVVIRDMLVFTTIALIVVRMVDRVRAQAVGFGVNNGAGGAGSRKFCPGRLRGLVQSQVIQHPPMLIGLD